MAGIPLPPITPLWEYPSTEIQRLSMWKQQLEVMYDLIDAQRAADKKLKDAEENQIMYAHIGAEAICQFEHSPAMGQIKTMTNDNFYKLIVAIFEQLTPQSITFYRFQMCKQHRDESTSEFLSRLRTLQADCKYMNFNSDIDLAYSLAQNCFSQDTQKRLFSSPTATLDAYVNIMQAAESAECSSAAIRRDSRNVHAIHSNNHRNNIGYLPHNRDISPNRAKRLQSLNRLSTCHGCGSRFHTYLSTKCKVKWAMGDYCQCKGHFPNFCEQQKWQQHNRSNQRVKNNDKAVRIVHLCAVTKNAAATYECTFRVVNPNGKDCFASSIVDSGTEASLLPYSLYTKWINAPLDESNVQLFRFNKSKIEGLRGQFTVTVEYNGRQAKVKMLVLDTIKVATWGTNTIKGLHLVINGATRQINIIQQDISTRPAAPAATINLVQTSADPVSYLKQISNDFPKLMVDGIGKFPNFEHHIMLTDDAITVARPV